MSTRKAKAQATDALKAHASEAMRKASDTLNDQANVLRDTATEARYSTQEFIENKPWEAVAVAAGIGFLLGVIVGRRR